MSILEWALRIQVPGAYYFGHEKNGSLAFEIGSGGFVKKEFPIKELRKIYHIQMKQFCQTNVSTKLRRSMKIDGKLMEDYEIDYQSISREISFKVRDIDDVGGHIYNLKVTE